MPTLKLGEKQKQQKEVNQKQQEETNPKQQEETNQSVAREPTIIDNNPKKRRKLSQDASVSDPSNILDNNVQLYLECSLCQAKRRFNVNTKNECWLERSDAIVQTVSLDQQ